MNKNCPYLEIQCENLECDCPKYKAYIGAKNPKIFNRVMKENKFDITMESFDLIMKMSHSFFRRVSDTDHLIKEEKERWIDKYLVCIEDEIREVREHLNLYTDVEKKDKDIELKKEVIDIIHFVMEMFVVGGANKKIIREFYEDIVHIHNEDESDLIKLAYNLQKDHIDEHLNTKNDISTDITILKASCRLSDACALVRQQISWKHWKKPSLYIDYNKLYHAFSVVYYEMINLCILTMNIDEIKDIFVKKNVENILRQEYGY